MPKRTHEQELDDFLHRGVAPENPKLFLQRMQTSETKAQDSPVVESPVKEKEKLPAEPLANENQGEVKSTAKQEPLPPLKTEDTTKPQGTEQPAEKPKEAEPK